MTVAAASRPVPLLGTLRAVLPVWVAMRVAVLLAVVVALAVRDGVVPDVDALLEAPLAYDVRHYLAIVEQGYGETPEGWAFLPGHPWSIAALAALTGSSVAGAWLQNAAAHLLLLVVLHRFLARRVGEDRAVAALWWMAALPPSFVLAVPYSEAPFLLGVLLCVDGVDRARTGRSGGGALLAAFTRQPGLFLAPGLLLDGLRAGRGIRALLPPLLAAAGSLAGIGVIVLAAGGETSLTGYVRDTQVGYASYFAPPWEVVPTVVADLVAGGHPSGLDLGLGLLLTGACLASLRHEPTWTLRIYVLLVVGASWTKTFSPEVEHSLLLGLPRHLLTASLLVPVLAVRAPLSGTGRLVLPLVAGVVNFLLAAAFVGGTWIP